MKLPRVMFAAGASGSGKTTIVCGILQALVNRNMKLASFKCGPDYIDPLFHKAVIETEAKNLDTFFTGDELTKYLFAKTASKVDFSIMEGVMGFYDGAGVTQLKASSYDLAKVTKTPVILIVNAKGMSLSVAAYIKGFLEYKEDSQIAGVLFNQMSPMVYETLKPVIEMELGIKVFGYVPKMEQEVLQSRHLGLVKPDELPQMKQWLMHLAKQMERSVDLDGILALGKTASELSITDPNVEKGWEKESVTIAVAKDEGFCFYYEDNLELLETLGARLLYFSPIHDKQLPKNADGMILGGGYPELYLESLSKNETMKQSIYEACENHLPYLAECGGFMYLHETMKNLEKQSYPMAGVIKGCAYPTEKLSRFGYIQLEPLQIKAHEFHYYDSTNNGTAQVAKKPFGKRQWNCMHETDVSLAGFPHLYYYSNPQVAKLFLTHCKQYKHRNE